MAVATTAAAPAPAAEGENADAAAAAAAEAAKAPAVLAAASGEELKVTIPAGAPVQYVRTTPHRSAYGQYTGFMAELDAARSSVRAWALTNGYEVTDRPFEIWKGGVDKAFTAEGEYDVYWQIK